MTVVALNLSDSLEEVAADGPWDDSLPEVDGGPLLGMAMIRSSYCNRVSVANGRKPTIFSWRDVEAVSIDEI